MSDKQNHPRAEETANTSYNMRESDGERVVITTGTAKLDEGALQIIYTETNGVGSAAITLDRDFDKKPDVTLQTGPDGGTYTLGGGKGEFRYTPQDAQKLTGQIRDILTGVRTDKNLLLPVFHQVVDFVNDPVAHGLPTVPGAKSQKTER